MSFFYSHANFSFYILLLYIVQFIVAITIIFLERKSPSSTIAWVMIIFILPVAGMVLYFLFSQNYTRRKLFKLTDREKEFVENPLLDQVAKMKDGVFEYSKPEEETWKSLISLNQAFGKSYLTQDNNVEILNNGISMFDFLLNDIKYAKESIHIEYFIVKNDDTGKKLLRALIDAAKRGVQVRFLVDALGTSKLDRNLVKEFEKFGGRIAYFFSPKYIKINLRFNYRNHRKIVVIDGRIGYAGGFNIGNEYLGKKKKFGHWRDTHIRMKGQAVSDIDARFILDWRMTSKEKLGLEQAYYDFAVPVGNTSMQIVSSGPDTDNQEIKHAYLKMINSAKKNICIQTPYFVPDQSIFTAIQTAALSGVDVKIMIPSIRDHIFVYWATYYYCGLLLKAGVKIYIYDAGFLHAKTISADGEVCSIGSANFDIRSFRLNFETNAFIYDCKVTAEMDKYYQEDLEQCRELTAEIYKKRSWTIKLREGIAKLLSDIL